LTTTTTATISSKEEEKGEKFLESMQQQAHSPIVAQSRWDAAADPETHAYTIKTRSWSYLGVECAGGHY
jgi:hypothetical protein